MQAPDTSRLPACMGGWCAMRGHCPLYHAADRSAPAERLCTPGLDGEVIGMQRGQVVMRVPSQQVGA